LHHHSRELGAAHIQHAVGHADEAVRGVENLRRERFDAFDFNSAVGLRLAEAIRRIANEESVSSLFD
jgi:hypothetical protein